MCKPPGMSSTDASAINGVQESHKAAFRNTVTNCVPFIAMTGALAVGLLIKTISSAISTKGTEPDDVPNHGASSGAIEAIVSEKNLHWQSTMIVLFSSVAAMAVGQFMTWIHTRSPPKAFYDPEPEADGTALAQVSTTETADDWPTDLALQQPSAPAPAPLHEEKRRLLRTVESEWIVQGLIPYWFLPAAVVFAVLGFVFVLPLLNDLATPYTPTMYKYLALYLLIDLVALRWALGVLNWKLLQRLHFTQAEIEKLAGPCPVIPTQEWLKRGGSWLYQCDSLSRKIPHVLHWAGLAQFTILAAHTPWARFQFSVMGATADIILLFAFSRTTAFVPNMLVWLASIRTNDGFARRMNLVYCKCSSVIGMGVTVPLSAFLLSQAFGDEYHSAFMFIVTLPCAYGDCLAEIIGVNGKIRFDVYGLGEKNNKSVEGMVAMFLGSVFPCLPFAAAVGGWPYLCIVGVFATIAETWTPRGFDNVTIPLASAFGAAVACKLSGGMGLAA